MSTAIIPAETGTLTSEKIRIADLDAEDVEAILPNGVTLAPSSSEQEASDGALSKSAIRQQDTIEDVPLIRLRDSSLRARRFKVLQQWEGIVDEMTEDSMIATIFDLTDSDKPQEIVEIPLIEIPEADHHLLASGCVFYWIIGYQTSPGGQKSRVSEIRIRRNPKWSHHDIETIRTKGKKLYNEFKASSGEGSSAKPR